MPLSRNPFVRASVPAIGLSLGSIGLVLGGAAVDQPALSLVGTLSLIVTPSSGHFYAGEDGRAWRSVAVRGRNRRVHRHDHRRLDRRAARRATAARARRRRPRALPIRGGATLNLVVSTP